MPAIRTFVAVGDSFTEGLHDEVGADGRHRGWADRVAAALATDDAAFRYANLAVRGRVLDEVVADQLPVALTLGADLVSFHAGANDVLRPGVDLPALVRRYDDAVATLRSTGTTVLLFTVLERVGATGPLAELLARRFAAFNTAVRATARRHGTVLVDIGDVAALHDRRMWHGDRLHLLPQGHARVTAAVLEALGREPRAGDGAPPGAAPGWWREPLPMARPSRPAAIAADLAWVVRHLAPWALRRLRGVSSGDEVVCKRPELTEVGASAPPHAHPSSRGPAPPIERRWTARGLDRFVGHIAAGAFASGDQVVLGLWRRSPLGRFVDVMWVRPDGERVLLAPDREVAGFVGALYTFDRVEVAEIVGGWDGHEIGVRAGPLQVRFVPDERGWRSWVFAARPRFLRRSPAWLAVEDRLVEPLGGVLLGGAEGVRVTGLTPSGRREWYGIDDYRRVGAGSLRIDGRDAGRLAELRPDLGVGLSAFPTRPALVTLVTLIEPASDAPGRLP